MLASENLAMAERLRGAGMLLGELDPAAAHGLIDADELHIALGLDAHRGELGGEACVEAAASLNASCICWLPSEPASNSRSFGKSYSVSARLIDPSSV